MSLTVKQRDLLLFIQRYQDEYHDLAPSFDEMREALELSSKSGVHRLLTALEDRGYIARTPSRARATTILKRAHDPRNGDARDVAARALEQMGADLTAENIDFIADALSQCAISSCGSVQ